MAKETNHGAEEKHLIYLDSLRESGVTNMFGAGTYLRERFSVTKMESHAILHYWMETFEERQKAIKAEAKKEDADLERAWHNAPKEDTH